MKFFERAKRRNPTVFEHILYIFLKKRKQINLFVKKSVLYNLIQIMKSETFSVKF